jgi:hypothetical protein
MKTKPNFSGGVNISLLSFCSAVIQPDDFTSTHDNECPATEVLQYRQKAGYFAASLDVRNVRPLHLRYRIGQVVKHRKLGYKGVVVGWDLQAKVLGLIPDTKLLSTVVLVFHTSRKVNFVLLSLHYLLALIIHVSQLMHDSAGHVSN